MHDSFDKPEEPDPRRDRTFQDSRYHDEDEFVPADDIDAPRTRPPARRKPTRRPPLRRHYDD
jgi:hypothetical protein